MAKPKRYVSIIINLPSGRVRTLELRINIRLLWPMLMLLGLALVGLGLWLGQYSRITMLAYRAEALTLRNGELEEENRKVVALAQELAAMQRLTKRIQRIASVASWDDTTRVVLAPSQPAAMENADQRSGTGWALEQTPSARQTSLLVHPEILKPGVIPTLWPVLNGWVAVEFGQGPGLFHQGYTGIDIVVEPRTPVCATTSGRIASIGWNKKYGTLIRIDHGSALVTRYGFRGVVLVQPGEPVSKGQIIALTGTGEGFAPPHLRYEIWLHGQPVNPRGYLPGDSPASAESITAFMAFDYPGWHGKFK